MVIFHDSSVITCTKLYMILGIVPKNCSQSVQSENAPLQSTASRKQTAKLYITRHNIKMTQFKVLTDSTSPCTISHKFLNLLKT